ncbi:MAG TPA: tRNA (adenosine(37)-N6)-threonylcarbamoyltransferase complex dimerization subunit type 1 TsaB [Cyanobacteria bacterium UBA11149]|nr:tRNA (adenosine(37)-N6)-threonylcarbamoyltransferase complex dimerization subunit type 1 TsaB [Cyanobacteria bacterium UBA11367]HBE59226.1 tRNA (adenosine(37)-N6)-threonylcarbamoyltransferase complex dimerization subunit type 1 TsaB [Cyanobacteria bacterium UBA11366]HBK66339.1 tRNA (adenosine(37)-N6)-threonylcarbamoyltransferase complex dimerization subunit type 1 TsaB [Cyanobacteria bacterium UBA11166]HBR76885.1 tRNA (adenosine(37)-N6)-threonylcarbamoyltransferase complex dimerization subuni
MPNLNPKYGLAIHTSSSELGLAISNFHSENRHQTWELGQDLSTHLHQYLLEFIQPQNWTDLAFIAVAKGPGSFTGTRIGIVTARTIAQQLNIPLFAISTLAAVAWSGRGGSNPVGGQSRSEISPTSSPTACLQQSFAIALQMPAQRGQLFTGIYQEKPNNLGLNELFSDTAIRPEVWSHTLNNLSIEYQLIDLPAAAQLGTSVSSLLELAYINWQEGARPHFSAALPFYGQHPVEGRELNKKLEVRG